eukprot:2848511-Lingulodinium_polyedra.AAC.1
MRCVRLVKERVGTGSDRFHPKSLRRLSDAGKQAAVGLFCAVEGGRQWPTGQRCLAYFLALHLGGTDRP